MTEINSAVYEQSEAGRSAKVRQHLENMRQTLSTINFDMAELLTEAQDKGYLAEWGHTLKTFCEQNLEIKERQAQYLMRVVRVSTSLGYVRQEIEGISISKLKEIFSLEPDNVWLNPDTQLHEKLDGHIRRLVELAPTTGLEAISAEVKRLKGLIGDNELTWWNVQVTRLTKDNVITPGLDAFRKYLGSKGVEEKAGSTEYSDGFVAEMIFAEILSGMPGEQGEDLEDEVVIGEQEYEEEAA
jgi:hypothetical protein